MRANGITVDDKPSKLGGGQRIVVNSKVFPMVIENGLCYLPMQPPTDEEMESLPQLIMTSDEPWDPTLFNINLPFDELIKSYPVSIGAPDDMYDDHGNLFLSATSSSSPVKIYSVRNHGSKNHEILYTFRSTAKIPSYSASMTEFTQSDIVQGLDQASDQVLNQGQEDQPSPQRHPRQQTQKHISMRHRP